MGVGVSVGDGFGGEGRGIRLREDRYRHVLVHDLRRAAVRERTRLERDLHRAVEHQSLRVGCEHADLLRLGLESALRRGDLEPEALLRTQRLRVERDLQQVVLKT
ncbi:hypothetical protein ACEXOS_019115 [Herbiconiux sp. P16]|uniref:hypothetical protein n=1 Tax=Herbiconiux wuyangfengii TaxID=3342794 RepID=UPI0035B80E96